MAEQRGETALASDQREASYSYLATLNECRRKFYYRYELGLADPDIPVLPFVGGVGHIGMKALIDSGGDLDVVAAAVEDAWGDFRVPAGHKHSHLSPGFITEVLRQWHERHMDDGWEPLATELEFSVTVGGQPFKGIIDLVRGDTYRPSIVDFKFTTGWLSGWWAKQNAFDISHQIRMYSIAARDIHSYECNEGYIMAIHMGESALAGEEKWQSRSTNPTELFGPYVLSPAREQETLEWIEEGYREIEWRRGLSNGEVSWPQNMNNKYTCARCPFYDLCSRAPAARGRLIDKWEHREDDTSRRPVGGGLRDDLVASLQRAKEGA